MTVCHVMQDVIDKKLSPDTVVVRFDYAMLQDGSIVQPGVKYHLKASDWLVDYSPHSASDTPPQHAKSVSAPKPDELDYAFLRLDGFAADNRGWIEPARSGNALRISDPLHIIQHPLGEALQVAFQPNSVIGLNENQTRVFYRTWAEPGSAGSPCLNRDWKLVALHHASTVTVSSTYKIGIPIAAVLQLLEERGLCDAVGW